METSLKPTGREKRHRQRQYLEYLIDQAIAALDDLDGDCDLEDNGDFEYSTGDRHGLEFDVVDYGDETLPDQIDQSPIVRGCADTRTLTA